MFGLTVKEGLLGQAGRVFNGELCGEVGLQWKQDGLTMFAWFPKFGSLGADGHAPTVEEWGEAGSRLGLALLPHLLWAAHLPTW